MHTGRQAGRKRRKDAKRKYAGMERDEQGRGEGGGGEREKDKMHASRQEGIKGRKEAKGKFTKESEIGSRENWEWKIGNGATMGLCGAILAEQSAYMIRRGPQHTIQWVWGGEICSFPPQGRRTVWVSINQASRRPDGVEKWDGTQFAGTPHNLYQPPPCIPGREFTINRP